MNVHPFYKRRSDHNNTSTTKHNYQRKIPYQKLWWEKERERKMNSPNQCEKKKQQLRTNYNDASKRLTKPRQCFYLCYMKLYMWFTHFKIAFFNCRIFYLLSFFCCFSVGVNRLFKAQQLSGVSSEIYSPHPTSSFNLLKALNFFLIFPENCLSLIISYL